MTAYSFTNRPDFTSTAFTADVYVGQLPLYAVVRPGFQPQIVSDPNPLPRLRLFRWLPW